MAVQPPFFLRDIWYYAMPSAHLAAGQMKKKMLLGEPVVFCRQADGKVFALRDICPHRATPLSYGKFDGEQVQCVYHGWKFDGTGTCRHIPSLCGTENMDPANIKVKTYKVQEQQGILWIYMEGEHSKKMAKLPEPPLLPIPGHLRPRTTEVVQINCHIDHGVIGLCDPAHGPFVHQSWFWRSPKGIKHKKKAFAPSDYGFAMVRHAPSSNSFAYKILGGKPMTEIVTRLPGIRYEHVQVGNKNVLNLTAVTPLSETQTELTNVMYWDIPFLTVLKPILAIFISTFFNQDKVAISQQAEGLKFEQNLIYIRDADTLARWYFQLKNEYKKALDEGRDFVNPVPETVLQWRT